MLHEAWIDGDAYALDTRELGKFPAIELILVYRGRTQHVMVGGSVAYRTFLD
jgi:hypothetical protein